ncbi:hypothetical protein OEZ85_008710 [Tetradesmus obliquus]|uniref:Peptidase M16 N-terminal domain-containing protein n=1 Tax=Tetradesmus obliquus TaxID=3088 RepID=A0ABY8TPA6_TETOB|nr:hypothetical protein OEZ85_008710 [Tetradesmus obliquus]
MQGLRGSTVVHQSVAVHKPRCDRRQYQHAELINGVRVLVIQDLDAVYAAASANVQVGYFDDPPSLPGAAHFVEHMVHLGSKQFPDEKEYKAFLAQHGGSSNASTSMVHTRYHFKVHAEALPGALARFGAMLSAPLIAHNSCAREVENVHAEYSRNTNSDGRKLLQLRRSLCLPPYSNFSTGSIATLWEGPQQHGADVAGMLRQLWQQHYRAGFTCVAVVGPQDPRQLLQALLVRVLPQRDLRELQLCWYIPAGVMAHSSTKPWQWASHLLGHEGPGSAAHLLKAQGLVQSLEAGMGEEVRAGRGWMFWRLTLSLTQAGEDALEHVVATVYRAIQVLQRCSDDQLHQTWQEAASLAQLRFDWRDPIEPLAAAQSAAYALHYYPPSEALSGPVLMSQYDASLLRWFVGQLNVPNMNVYYSSRRNAGMVGSKEAWYGAEYGVQQLPQAWLDSIAQYTAVDGQGCADADFSLRLEHGETAEAAAAAAAGGGGGAASYDGAAPPPTQLLQQPGLCVWHCKDISYGLPKVHLRLHLVTPAAYASPASTISTRLLLRVLEDLLLPQAYPAELAGSSYSLDSEQGGLLLRLVGFPGVVQQLLGLVLRGLLGLTAQQSPATQPDALAAAVRGWLCGFRQELQQMASGEVLQNQKKALSAKYLDPPKSLQEAAKRSWRPIRERTLQWDRRRQKAAAAQALTAQQLLDFFDQQLHPDAAQHQALCVQIWGGRKAALAVAAAGELGAAADAGPPSGAVGPVRPGVAGSQQLTVLADEVEQFKRSQPLMPAPEIIMPPPAVSSGTPQAAL